MNSLEVKRYIKPSDIADRYLGQPNKVNGRNKFYKSPFRNERTASLCVNDSKGFTDFGDGWHGDIFTFIGRLFDMNFTDSYKFLRQEFGLGSDNEYETDSITRTLKEQLKQKARYEKAVNTWFERNYDYICTLYDTWVEIMHNANNYELRYYAQQKKDYYDYVLEELRDADKFKLYEEVRNGGETAKVLLPI